MTAVIAGASGLVGSVLIKKLLADGEIKTIVSLSRRPLGWQDPRLSEVLIKDLNEMGSRAAELRGDIYFCCLGTTIKTAGSQDAFRKVDHDAVVDFGRIAKSHGAHSFNLVSAMGANARSFIFYNRVKGETEADLQKLGFERLTIFRPSLLIGERHEHRTGEKIFISLYKGLKAFLPTAVLRRLGTDVNALAEALLRESKTAGPGSQVIEASDIA